MHISHLFSDSLKISHFSASKTLHRFNNNLSGLLLFKKLRFCFFFSFPSFLQSLFFAFLFRDVAEGRGVFVRFLRSRTHLFIGLRRGAVSCSELLI